MNRGERWRWLWHGSNARRIVHAAAAPTLSAVWQASERASSLTLPSTALSASLTYRVPSRRARSASSSARLTMQRVVSPPNGDAFERSAYTPSGVEKALRLIDTQGARDFGRVHRSTGDRSIDRAEGAEEERNSQRSATSLDDQPEAPEALSRRTA